MSITQPHVRPIVRGKARANVEFGAKVAVSLVDGYVMMEELRWDAYNEAGTLQQSVEAYRKRYGCYPEAILADKIYRNRENLQYCKERNIRLSGPSLGRPSKHEPVTQKQLAKQDAPHLSFPRLKECYEQSTSKQNSNCHLALIAWLMVRQIRFLQGGKRVGQKELAFCPVE